jgi:hypothetical protein
VSLKSITNEVLAGLIVAAVSALIGLLSDSTTVQVIAYLIAAAMLAVVVLLLTRRRTNDAKAALEDFDVAPHPSPFEEKAYTLLEAIYDLAGGDPTTYVDISEAAERAGLANTAGNINPVCRFLKNDEGYIDRIFAGWDVITITPTGIKAVRQQRGL